MRVTILLCVLTQVLAGPGKPVVSIGLNSDALESGPIGALEPQVKWQTSGTYAGCDVSGGINLKIKDVDDLPCGLWGKIKGSYSGIDLSARVDTTSSSLTTLGLDLQAATPTGTSLQVTGVANTEEPSVTVGNVKLSQKIRTDFGSFTVTPKYNVASSSADVKVAYGRDDTMIILDATADKQKVTVSQAIGDNVLTPSFSSDGDVEFSYSRSVGSGLLTTNYKPDSHVGLTYEDGPWVATIKAPVDGVYKVDTKGAKFSVRTSVDVTSLGMP